MKKKFELSESSLIYQKSIESDGNKLFKRFRDIPVNMLEIGVFEGGSAIWFLENILTHPDSTYTGVDDNVRTVARNNLSQFSNTINIISGDSVVVLPQLIQKNKKYDIIYIDGCHNVEYVLHDIKNSIDLLSKDGIILIDDYKHEDYQLVEPIKEFLERQERVEVIHESYRLGLRLIDHVNLGKDFPTFTGDIPRHKIENEDGHLYYRFAPGNIVEIVDLCVFKDKRTGIGRKLIEQLLSDPKVRNNNLVYVFTRGDNEIAQKFYENVGFKLIATIPWFYRGESLDRFGMMYGYQFSQHRE